MRMQQQIYTLVAISVHFMDKKPGILQRNLAELNYKLSGASISGFEWQRINYN